ncbi:hypothetical protein HN51_056134 [Arachis hypogaea]|uniref:Protein ENHANCED DISEASE RESISTANCE n=1 Tax=Arachis hypogaea TaxID=3818 RepID=A0A6B9VFI0_ARAHY|nr:protein ENHANCED DISEASE RESISTANCE 2-like [Arachis hypogaea]QHN78928.1 Protein ENHANCED DISEASE RESISTANCE [Arachis hypogaea]
MGVPSQSSSGEKMEGFLYLLRHNRFGQHSSRKRYFIIKDNVLRSFKTKPVSQMEEPIRSAIIDSSIRVTDNGWENINKKVLFTFTAYHTSNQRDKLKLGATSPEEAAKWIKSLQEAALKDCPSPTRKYVTSHRRRRRSSLRNGGTKSIDWKHSELDLNGYIYSEAMTSDVIAPSTWKIFGCQNGLRMFKEAKEWDALGRWGDSQAIMAVGVVDGTSEDIFNTLMCLDPSRSEWDFCVNRGSVVEHFDGHTDLIHLELYNDWLPWGMKKRDFLLQRYWRREDDGTYVILYQSVYHKKCPPQRGYVRACLKSGGYVVTPVNNGTQSVVKHMLAVDWKYWKLYLRPANARAITVRMLERVAALRELFKTKGGSFHTESIAGTKDIVGLPPLDEDQKDEVEEKNSSKNIEEGSVVEDEVQKVAASSQTGLMGFNDSKDEFFDVPDYTSDYYDTPNDWNSELESEKMPLTHTKASPSSLVKKLQDLAIPKKGLEFDVGKEGSGRCYYGTTLQKDPKCALPCSWAASDPSLFLIRGETYLTDNQKVKAKRTLMELVGADWLRSNQREDNLSSRLDSIVQEYAAKGGPEFFFVINIQMPGNPMYSMALYYMMKTPLEDYPLLQSFVDGDDTYRNSRFKLIPYISKGSWIVKQSVGRKACLVGQALEIRYIRGKNYLELDIDVGSSTVARGVASLVLGYLNNLVIEMAFLIQGNTQDELPEILLGTCRVNHMDASKAFVLI